jgi:hypothetical protein
MKRWDALVVRAREKFAEPKGRELPPFMAETKKLGKFLSAI